MITPYSSSSTLVFCGISSASGMNLLPQALQTHIPFSNTMSFELQLIQFVFFMINSHHSQHLLSCLCIHSCLTMNPIRNTPALNCQIITVFHPVLFVRQLLICAFLRAVRVQTVKTAGASLLASVGFTVCTHSATARHPEDIFSSDGWHRVINYPKYSCIKLSNNN